MSALRPKYLRIGPGSDGSPVVEVEMATGELAAIRLDRAHGRSIANRLLDCVSGAIGYRAPSRRVLEIELFDPATADPAVAP